MAKRAARNLKDRVLLQQRGLDDNGDPLGEWVTVPSSTSEGAWAAQITRLRGGETVMAQRLQGVQPVVIGLRASTVTRSVDNAWRAIDALTRQIYEITDASEDDTRTWVDVLAKAQAGDRLPA